MFTKQQVEALCHLFKPWSILEYGSVANEEREKEMNNTRSRLISEGKIPKDANIYSKIERMEYLGERLIIDVSPGCHPFDAKFFPPYATGSLLSILGSLYASKNGDVNSPAWYVYQVRGSKISDEQKMKIFNDQMPAPGMIQTTDAGFVNCHMTPSETQRMELNKEALAKYRINTKDCEFVEWSGNKLEIVEQPKRVMNLRQFTLKTGHENPLLTFLMHTEEKYIERIPIAEDVGDFRPTKEELQSGETAKLVRVRWDNLRNVNAEIERLSKTPQENLEDSEKGLMEYGPITTEVGFVIGQF